MPRLIEGVESRMFKPYSDTEDEKPSPETAAPNDAHLGPISPLPPNAKPAKPAKPAEARKTAFSESPKIKPLPPAADEAWRMRAFILWRSNSKVAYGSSRRLAQQGGGVLLIVAAVCLVAAIVIAGPTFIAANSLAMRGKIVMGLVINSRYTISQGKSGPSYTYYVTYQYRLADERVISHEQVVSLGNYYRLTANTPVTVMYDPQNPTNAQLAGNDRDDSGYNSAMTMGVVVLVFGAIMGVVGTPILMRTLALQRSQTIVRGIIIGASGSTYKGNFTAKIRYQFHSPSGRLLEGTNSARRNDLRRDLPPTGTEVCVIYVNDKLYRML